MTRRPSCAHYHTCLADAAKANRPGVPCEGCPRYQLGEPDDAEQILRTILLAAVILEIEGFKDLYAK